MARVAFIGLGNMGAPMARNLLKAGHSLKIFDLNPAVVDKLVSAGADSSETALSAAQQADIVITMLPAGKHVESVYLGEEGLLQRLSSRPLLIDSSTIDSETAKKVAAEAERKGFSMLDAPVSGGVAAAAAGTLSFMCGGSDSAFSQGKEVLGAMGKNLFHAGDHGAGQTAKACNNMLLAILMSGTSEALQLGVDNGLDPKVLSEIMLASSGRNWTLEVYNPYPGVMEKAPASNDYQPGFMVDLMAKDLGLAEEMAVKSGSAIPMGSNARNLYVAHQKKGNGSKDFSSIIQELK